VTAGAQARVALAAFAATMLTALTLAPLVQGFSWLVATLLVVSLTAGVGASTRQVTGQPMVVAVAEVAMLVITLTALFARDTALWGVLPGPAAADSLRALIADGLDVTRRDSPPVEATRGLLLVISGGVGIIGLLVDLVAVTLRRPAAAGLPLLAVYCVPAAVLPGGLPWTYFLLCGAGYLVLVGADAGDRVQSWGQVLSGSAANPMASLGGPFSGARRVAVTCLVVAAAAPALVPGLGDQLLSQGNGSGRGKGGRTTISVVNPILNLRSDLGSPSNTVVIRYTSDVTNPQPLRIVTDDQFTGAVWQPTTGALARSQTVQAGLPSPPGLSHTVATTEHSTRISIDALAQTYLPLPYPTKRVDIQGTWLWEPRTLNVVGEGTTTQNLSYTATYLLVTPSPAQLSAAAQPTVDVVARYTALPKGLPTSIARLARTVAGLGTEYDQAVRLQSWFRNGGGFAYSERAPGNGRADSGQDAVAAFLQDRTGYCVHFASAMAVMARTLGIPARVAVGFLPGTPEEPGTYVIALRDAHAWPELYFEGIGWVRFEPTPATRSGPPPVWTMPQSDTEPPPSASASAGTGPSTGLTARARPDLPEAAAGTGGTGSGPLQRLRSIPWRLLGVMALALLGLAAPRLATELARWRRWRRAATGVQRAEAAWEELRLRLQDLGIGWAASWTPRALQLRLVRERGLSPAQEAAMARLVTDLERARYAPPGAQVRPADELRADVRTVVAGVAASVATGVRRRALLMPASGLASLAGLVRNADTAANRASARASSLGSQIRRSVGAGSRKD
jgi:transglutaminase-like putative cysteine protease